MKQQQDIAQFEKIIHVEKKTIFDNAIWTKVSKQLMFTYYDGLPKAYNLRKPNLDSRLSKYKGTLFIMVDSNNGESNIRKHIP